MPVGTQDRSSAVTVAVSSTGRPGRCVAASLVTLVEVSAHIGTSWSSSPMASAHAYSQLSEK